MGSHFSEKTQPGPPAGKRLPRGNPDRTLVGENLTIESMASTSVAFIPLEDISSRPTHPTNGGGEATNALVGWLILPNGIDKRS